jgi:hypothetical protein
MSDTSKPEETGGLGTALKRAAEMGSQALGAAKEAATLAYEVSGLHVAVEGVGFVASKLDERTGIVTKTREAVGGAADVMGDTLDKVSGHALLSRVEDCLATQATYNNLLATKLDEALQRIAALEARLSSGG